MKKLIYLAFPFVIAACAENNDSTGENQKPTPASTQPAIGPGSAGTESTSNSGSNTPAQNSEPTQTQTSANTNYPMSTERVPEELENEIKRVMDLMAKDEIKMIRNKETLEAAKATKHLIGKYMTLKNKIRTWEDFVREVATESSSTGAAYMVVDKKRKQTPLNEYLNKLHSKK